jgi:DNA-binding HxlR family transcriptional regulator
VTANQAAGSDLGSEAPTTSERPARRSGCPVACALDVVGDRWTLLLVRDLLAGKRRYGDFLASFERIPTNILAERLRRLERHGLITSTLYSQHPPRREYSLTPAGWKLGRVVEALADWGLEQFPGTERRGGPPAPPKHTQQ